MRTVLDWVQQGKLARLSYVNSAAKFGLKYFVQHQMPPSFDYHKYDGRYSPYFLKWGIKVPLAPMVFYSLTSGIDSDRFIDHGFAYRYLYPYLDRYQYIPAYHDKRIQAHMVHLDDPHRCFSAQACETIVANVNGMYYDSDFQEISLPTASGILSSYGYPMIIKP